MNEARLHSGRQDPPRLLPGQVPLLTENEGSGCLWLFDPTGEDPAAIDDGRPLGALALESWHRARLALSAAIPVLWRPISRRSSTPRRAFRVGSLPRQGTFEPADVAIDGPSFGLSFVLSLAAQALGRPIPEDLAATGALDERGSALPVGGLGPKIATLETRAPRVRRLLVAQSQRDDAIRHARRLTIVAVRSVRDALREAFGDLEQALIEAGDPPERREALVGAFLDLVLGGRKGVPDWTPVARAAEIALANWSFDREEDRSALRFVHAVASRHEWNTGDLSWIEPWLPGLPAPLRLEAIAHLVQQSADSGAPPAAEAERIARGVLDSGRDRFIVHRRIEGALGRLLAVEGRPEDALELQRGAAEAFLGLGALARGEVSFPLSAWFLLAGQLGGDEQFEAADRCMAKAIERDLLDEDGTPYVERARSTALVLLGRSQDARRPLAELVEDGELLGHVQASAMRWLLRALRDLGHDPEAETLQARLDEHEASDKGVWSLFGRLAALDRAIRGGDAGRCDEALDEAVRVAGSLGKRLLRVCTTTGVERAECFARWFPY